MLVIVFATSDNMPILRPDERKIYRDQVHEMIERALNEPLLTSVDISLVPPDSRVRVVIEKE